ncbi:MAG: ATP-binding protein [Chitinispirillaceae bacterium]|nr:ATP-binding protein [Chitinispirillaceae bacterium]
MGTKEIDFITEEISGFENITVVHIAGSLESHSVEKIIVFFETIITKSKAFVIAEMSNVVSISSAVLGELMGCRKRLIENNGDLVLCGLNLELHTKLNLMGATKVFKIYSDVRSALNAYKWEIEKKPEKIHIQFPPFLKIVPPLRQFISRIARQKGYSNKDSFRIETIVDEVCNNAVEHGKSGSNSSVDLNVIIDPDKIEIEIRNISDPEKAALLTTLLLQGGSELTKIKPDVKRGRGLRLIKMLSNELKVECTDEGTVVHVKKIREE